MERKIDSILDMLALFYANKHLNERLIRKEKRANMGCMHTNTVKMGEAKCCLDCGYTIAPNRPPFFDKDIVNYNSKKERKKGNVKKS